MTAPILELRRIGHAFGGLRALHQIDLTVAKGEVLGIMGANGAGKTTLFALIAGHLVPSQGDILLDGKSIAGLAPDQISRRGIGRTFQTVRPFGGLTVIENVVIAARFGSDRLGTSEAARRGRDLLAVVGLHERSRELAESLTLSAQKRLELARAIATGARVVLLDEVMAGLTPTEVGQMLEIIRELRAMRNLTVIIIEHVMRALMHISDRILVLHHGEMIAIGTADEIRSDQRVLDCYLGKRS